MRKTITKEVTLCDKCRKEEHVTPCLRCGLEVCWRCMDEVGIKYSHGIYAGGTGDGFYCRPCDIALCETNDDELHEAYRAVARLRFEVEAFGADFQKRQKAAEQRVATLTRRSGLVS